MKTQSEVMLLRKFHAVCKQYGLTDADKDAIKMSYQVESSKDFTERQLIDIITKIEKQNVGNGTAMNQWRKRVIAVIGAWLRYTNKAEGIEIIKAIACRASGANDFNAITEAKLRIIYNEWLEKNKVFTRVNTIVSNEYRNSAMHN
jgi:hypothetical protein